MPAILEILGFIFQNIVNKDFRDGLKKLRNIQRDAERKNTLYDGDFFRGILSSKGKKGIIRIFIDGLPAKSEKREKINLLNAVKESYLIIGESGCGKSSFLHQDYNLNTFTFIKKTFPFVNLYNYLFTFSLFLSANQISNLDDGIIKEIKENYAFSSIKHTILYLDGLDELGNQFESKKDLIIELINLMKTADKCEVKVSCRSNFFKHNNSFNDIFSNENFPAGYQVFEIDNWDSETLEEIAESVLTNKNLNKTLKNQSDKIYKKAQNWKKSFLMTLHTKPNVVFKNERTSDKCLINSPLLLMLFLYTNLFTEDEISISKLISRYELYEKFINAIGKSAGAASHVVQKEKKILSEIAFGHFIQNNTVDFQRIYNSKLSDVHILLKLIKKQSYNEDIEINFIHYSFLDFFVAYYYQLIILASGLESEQYVKVLGADYPNDIADFITDALQLNKPNNEIADNMCKIYSGIMHIRKAKALTRDTFLAKKEIAFRLGRFFYSSKEVRGRISAFLKNIYYTDNKTFTNDLDHDIHLAMLKRWIAIAGSLLNTEDGEEIELDYIKKMICNTYENNLEDMANRSQTLVFYGDVTDVSSLDYRDDIPENDCAVSVQKRINRLLNINDKSSYDLLNRNLNPREPDLKYYCFRAFDLASIYCLLRFHGGSNSLFIDEMKRKNSKMKIDDIRVSFENANPEREKIMKLLLQALNNKSLPEKIEIGESAS